MNSGATQVHALVESAGGVVAARAAAAGGAVSWHTTSPMLVERLSAAGESVQWADAMLPAGCAQRIGEACLATAVETERAIAPIAAALAWPQLTPMMCLSLFQLLAVLSFKRAVVESFAQGAGRRLVAGRVGLTPVAEGMLQPGRFDELFATVSEGSGVELVRVADRGDAASRIGEVNRASLWDRLLSILDVSPGQVTYRALRYLMKNRRIGLGRGMPRILVARDNEVIREILPRIVARGASIEHLRNGAKAAPETPEPGVPGADQLSETLALQLARAGVRIDARPVAAIAGERLREASRSWRPIRNAAERSADALFAAGGPAAILTNSVNTLPLAALIAAAGVRGVRSIVAEHGVSAGLSSFHEPIRRWSEPCLADVYLACSEGTARFFGAEPRLHQKEIVAIGLARQMRRTPLRLVQRLAARVRLGARVGQRVVLYVPRFVQNNMRKGLYWSEDHQLHSIQRTMAGKVLPRVRGVAAIKLYSTQRYADGDPFWEGFAAPPPVRTLKAGDFRFLRAGCDVIILESPLSTLGWAFGAGKPLVYLADPAAPVLPEIRQALEASIIVIDLATPDWPDRLLASINRPSREIRAEWRAKATARAAFLEHHVFGPNDPGRRGAEIVVAMARSGRSNVSYAPQVVR
jgi:hypothetical protein